MIDRKKVENIILLNDAYRLSKSTAKDDLLHAILSLSKEDLFDLCALMTCGREMPKKCTIIDFSKERASFLEGHDKEAPAHLANYLTSKSLKLSQYLEAALHLTEPEDFKF
ncbi:MAG: hypothetical protein IKD18_07075 [Clostridia bacterium]|nr:hypothetical protein [Clostridia bacterium]